MCGTSHTLLLTGKTISNSFEVLSYSYNSSIESGHVYSMGNNNKGQLGVETAQFRDRPSPTLVESLSNFHIASIAAGGDCSFAVTSSGSVFAWGDGNLGQLGLGNFMRTDIPQKVIFGAGRYLADAKI